MRDIELTSECIKRKFEKSSGVKPMKKCAIKMEVELEKMAFA